MRLIDADTICEGMVEGWQTVLIKAQVDNAPTVDAVAVTRCKDCKHYRNHPNGLCYLHTESKANARGYSGDAVCVEPDDFCSYGERREE
jgi:hypothetical protein